MKHLFGAVLVLFLGAVALVGAQSQEKAITVFLTAAPVQTADKDTRKQHEPSSGVARGEAQTGRTNVLERGEIARGVYSNRYFGLRLRLPPGWVALTDDELVWPPISGILKQIRGGAPLASLPAIPLFVIVDAGTPPAGAQAAATIMAVAAQIDPADLKKPLRDLAESARLSREKQLPGERFVVGYEELAGKPVAVIDGKAPNGMRQHQWVIRSRGYLLLLAGNYENREELDQIRAALNTVTWMPEG